MAVQVGHAVSPVGSTGQGTLQPYGAAGGSASDGQFCSHLLGEPEAHTAQWRGNRGIGPVQVRGCGKAMAGVGDLAQQLPVAPESELSAATAVPYRVGHDLVDGDGEVVDLSTRHPALAGSTAHLLACLGQ